AIAEEHHLPRFGIDLGMGGEALCGAGVVEIAARRQRDRIDLEGLVAFFEREELARMPDDIGVCDAAVLAGDRRVGGSGIAESAEQRAPGLMLHGPFRCAHETVAIGYLAIG